MLFAYWTGTYNTRYVTNMLTELFKNDYDIDVIEVDINTPKHLDVSNYDLIGIGYPIYGFSVPGFFESWVFRQNWNKNSKIFIYKNSGETLSANDASSYRLVDSFKKKNIEITNEYHFIMPYNIHFRFEDNLISEMLEINRKLAKIAYFEITNNIKNIKKYSLINKFITFNVGIVRICGPINSFFYRIDNNKCTKCQLCIKNCPMNNIYMDKNGRVKLHHRCETCMRCSFFCPTNAFTIGLLDGWRVNGKYQLDKLAKVKNEKPVISEDTTGFFECYKQTYKNVNERYIELGLNKNQ